MESLVSPSCRGHVVVKNRGSGRLKVRLRGREKCNDVGSKIETKNVAGHKNSLRQPAA